MMAEGFTPTLPREEWRPVAVGDYGAFYQVSSRGRVRRTHYRSHNVCQRLKRPALISLKKRGKGYRGVDLCLNGVKESFYVHDLVLVTFLRPRTPGFEAAHLDGKRSNNLISNLIWATCGTNAEHRRLHGTMPMGEKHANSKLTVDAVRHIRRARRPEIAKLAARYGVSRSLISQISQGKGWKHVR